MGFKKYQHIERFGTDEVEGIELGECYVFPKIDGSNGSVWQNDYGSVCAGSRNRELSLDNDNAGFMEYAIKHEGIKQYLRRHPNRRLYGEWLVPHSLKTYREDAWRKFYVFDIQDEEDNYIPYDVYKEELDKCGVDYIVLLAKIKNGSYEQFIHQLQNNVFLVEDGKGVGEGIVIKNYGFYNRFNRQTWAKIVTSEFKEKAHKEMGAPEIAGKRMVEEEFIEEYCTHALIEKVYQGIVSECNGWRSQYIPRLLSTVFHDMVTEETWHFIKKNKNPVINFKTLNHLLVSKVKNVKCELF